MTAAKQWQLYDALIEGIPEDSRVEDCLIGLRWTLVRSAGTGMALTPFEGHHRLEGAGGFVGKPTRELAALIKSWNPMEATLGTAAVNSWYNAPSVQEATWLADPHDAPGRNAFERYRERLLGKKVAVIGHFPGLDDLGQVCELSILERRPQGGDFPDPAAEYLLPQQDAVFITGTTLINKTLPRLLELSKDAFTVLVGPSTPLTPRLFAHGVSALAGTVVADEARVWRYVAEGGDRTVFAHGARMVRREPGMETSRG